MVSCLLNFHQINFSLSLSTPPLLLLFLSTPKGWVLLFHMPKSSVGDLEVVDQGEEEEDR